MRPLLTSLMAGAMLNLVSINAGASEAAKAIEAVNQAFENGFKQSSAAEIAAVYTQEGQLLPPNGEFVSGSSAIEAFWQSAIDSGIKQADLETIELDQQGDTAIEVGRYTLSGSAGATLDQGKYIVVWKLENGEWKYHRDMWSSSQSAE